MTLGRAVFALLISALLFGCATSGTNVKPGYKLKTNAATGLVVGTVTVAGGPLASRPILSYERVDWDVRGRLGFDHAVSSPSSRNDPPHCLMKTVMIELPEGEYRISEIDFPYSSQLGDFSYHADVDVRFRAVAGSAVYLGDLFMQARTLSWPRGVVEEIRSMSVRDLFDADAQIFDATFPSVQIRRSPAALFRIGGS